MEDDSSLGWRAGTGWVPLGSVLESICGWGSIATSSSALADITLKGRCLVKWPVQCHMNLCTANISSHHHHGMYGSRSTNRVFNVGLWQAHQTSPPFRRGARNGERQASSGSFQRASCAGEQVGRAGTLKVLWLLQRYCLHVSTLGCHVWRGSESRLGALPPPPTLGLLV